MKKILFVCTGNTCRSAMAECILKALIKQSDIKNVKVSSAGINVTENAMNPLARKALNAIGVKPRKFVPKQVDGVLCSKQNAIICMTSEQKSVFDNFSGVYTVDELTGLGDVSDPYGGDEEMYINTAKMLYKACEIILNLIIEE